MRLCKIDRAVDVGSEQFIGTLRFMRSDFVCLCIGIFFEFVKVVFRGGVVGIVDVGDARERLAVTRFERFYARACGIVQRENARLRGGGRACFRCGGDQDCFAGCREIFCIGFFDFESGGFAVFARFVRAEFVSGGA